MKDQFGLPDTHINLNSGTQSSYPLVVRDHILALKEKYRINPTLGHIEFVPAIWQAQTKMASFFNLDPDDFFYCHNVTEALNHFIMGMDHTHIGRIVTADLEYGATINICRYKAEKDDIPLKMLSLNHLRGENGLIDYSALLGELEKEIKPGDLLVLSHILTSNGDILPIEKIGGICRKKGAILAIDGAHAPGAFKLDFSKFKDIAFYGGNIHKWMMGPSGTGFGWINPKSAHLVSSLTAGWSTYDDILHLEEFKGKNLSKEFYLKGTLDFSNFMGLNPLLDFWQQTGPENIFQKRKNLRRLLFTRIEEKLGWNLLSSHWEVSPLISFELPIKLSEMGWGLMQRLWKEHQLLVSTPRYFDRHIIRLSPNIYNGVNEMVQAVDLLKSFNDRLG